MAIMNKLNNNMKIALIESSRGKTLISQFA